MSNFKIYTICFLILSNIAFSFGIVWIEHLNRSQYREIQVQLNKKIELKNEWRKARIDERLYASHSRIEKDARNLLNMSLPKKKVLIKIND